MTKKMSNILEEVNVVKYEDTYSVPVKNGIPYEENVKELRKRVLNHCLIHLEKELVKTSQEFPVDEKSDITFTADFVILKGKDYRQLIQDNNE